MKEGGRYNTPSPISLSNTFYTKPNWKITSFSQHSSDISCQLNWKRNTSKQIVVEMLYMEFKLADPKAENSSIWSCWFINGSFYELANPLCLYIWHRNCVIVPFMCIFSVFIGQKCCIHTCMYCWFMCECAICVWTLM